MTKYLNFFESESGFTEAVEAGQLFFPNVSYTEDNDTVHWNLEQPADPVETPMLRMHFTTSAPGQEVALHRNSGAGVTAMEIDGTPVNYASTYSIAEPGNHTAVYQFASSKIPEGCFNSESGEFDTFTSAEIISAVTEIGYNAFNRCGGLTGVSMSDSVTYISTGAFDNCPLLQSVVLSDNLTSIWVGAFRQCPALTSIDIPDSVTTIAFQAFAFTGLRSVTVPDSVTNLSNECFARCGDLRSAVIGSGVTTVGEKAFSGCGDLTEIYFNSETPPTLGADALTNTNDCPIYVPAASVETYKQAWSAYAARIMPIGGVQYSIMASVNDDSLGVVNVQETASEGDTVNFHVNVFDTENCEVESISAHDGNGDEVQVTDEGDNSYSFTMPGSEVFVSAYIRNNLEGQHRISVSVNDEDLGQVDVLNGETASKGDWVGFNVNVFDTEHYEATHISVTDRNGDEVQVNDEGDNSYSFTMPASDVTISVVIGEKEKTKYTVTVNSTDDLVTDVAIINEETGDWNWDYEGELSFPEGEPADFAIRVPDGYLAVSVQASEDWGGSIDDVDMNRLGDDGAYECSFTMPASNVTVFITVEADTRPRYNISASVNDNSLGEIDLHQDIALEGETVGFDVKVFDTDANHVSSVTCTDGNGNEIKCWWDFDERDYSRYHINDMPASDVTIFATIEKKQ